MHRIKILEVLCGTEIPVDSQFCVKCGEKVVTSGDFEKKVETKAEIQSNFKSVFQKIKQSMWGEILIVLLVGIVGIAGILVLYMIGSALLEAGHVGIVMVALFLFCDGTFAWLTYDYAKKKDMERLHIQEFFYSYNR